MDEATKRELAQDAVRREMERESKDIWRIYNPLDHDFRYMLDSRWFTVKAQSTKDVQKFEARHYFKKISEYMIGQQMLLKGDALLKKRKEQGLPEFLNKYDENKAVWDNTPRLNDENLLKEIRDIVILGLVEEYGLDLPEAVEINQKQDTRPIHEQLFSEIKRYAPDDEPVVKPLKKETHE